MARRQFQVLAEFAQSGYVFLAFGFISTLIGTNPPAATLFGFGGLTGNDASGNVPPGAASIIESIVKTANNGEFLVTLVDGYRAVWFGQPGVWGPVAGPNDGVRAAMSLPANQGQGHTTKVTFLITMLNAAGAPTETNGRTVNCLMVFKDNGSGS